jgi:hypothetical protein
MKAWLPSQERGVAGAHHDKHGYQGRKRQTEVQCSRYAHVIGDDHHSVGSSVHAWSAPDRCRRRNRPSIDRKAGLRRDGFRRELAFALNTGKIPPARLQLHWRGAIGDGQAASGRPVKSFSSSPQTFQSLLRTCRMRYHWQRRIELSVGSRRSRSHLMKTRTKCNGAKMMTGTKTCYSPT